MKKTKLTVLAALTLGLAMSPPAVWPLWGSLVVLMELDELVEASDSIVQGEVESVQSRWEHRQIFTYVTIGIADPIKGSRSRTVVVRQLGGKVGSLVATVPGMPEFVRGDEVILFLKDSGNGTYHVVGMNQGRYLVSDRFAVSNLSGVDLFGSKAGVVRGGSTATRVEVRSFKRRIRELAQ
jgi:hypothetical protein